MALVTVAELKAVLGTGNLYPDADLQIACDTADAVVRSYLTANNYGITHYSRLDDVATVWTSSPHGFIVGQSITISGVASGWNGAKTLTEVGVYWFKFVSAGADQEAIKLVPVGLATGPSNVNYDAVAACKEAALQIAVDVWTNHLAPGGQPQAVDFTPSPYRMGRTIMQRVIGILAPYLDTRSLVG